MWKFIKKESLDQKNQGVEMQEIIHKKRGLYEK